MKNPFKKETMANAATKTGIKLLTNNVMDSATLKRMKNITPNNVALSASLFKFAEGYKINTKQKDISAIKGIMINVLATT